MPSQCPKCGYGGLKLIDIVKLIYRCQRCYHKWWEDIEMTLNLDINKVGAEPQPAEPKQEMEQQPPENQTGVVKRVFHTRTEFTFYPDGRVFPGKVTGFFEDHIYPVHKKEKKTIIPSQAKLNEEVVL